MSLTAALEGQPQQNSVTEDLREGALTSKQVPGTFEESMIQEKAREWHRHLTDG